MSDPILSQRLLGLDFPNPIGLAAGFDKNREVVGQCFSWVWFCRNWNCYS